MTVAKDRPSSQAEELGLEDRARQGDRAAGAELLARYRERLVRFCHGYLGSGDRAEDAAQDVLAKMASFERWPQGSFRAWLYRVARNHCLNLERRRRGAPVETGGAFASSQLLSPRTGPRTALARRERDEQLQAAMASLSRAHAEVLFLRYFEDLSREEIAAVLELSESVVKSRLSRARRELARRMERQRRDETP